jgi:serine/threonine protein kinase
MDQGKGQENLGAPEAAGLPTMSSSQQFASAGAHVVEAIHLGPPTRPGQLGSLDRYEILREIGRGGMGVVYLARDPTSAKQVAIKLIQPAMARLPRAVHRFLVEARHMSRLAHPHILPVIEVCERPAGPYFVMPYMQRGSLCRHIHPAQSLAADDATRIARQVAEALQFAHAKGVIHHDLKTDNVLLDAEGNAYLSDFGLARSVFADSVVDVGLPQREGTAPYMAPEIARGEAGDTRADIYSWGVIVYEMLTGDLPHEGKSREAVMSAILHAAPRPIVQRNPAAQPGLAKVAEWAMSPELRARYALFADVLADLERVGRGVPPVGPGTTAISRRRRISKRVGWLAAAATGAIGTFVAFVANRPQLVLTKEFQPWTDQPDAGAAIGDWDGDGELDIVFVEGGQIIVHSAEGVELHRRRLDMPATSAPKLQGLWDIAGDAAAEAVVTWEDKSDLYLTALNQHLVPTREWRDAGGAIGNDGRDHRNGFGSPAFFDLDHDGRREMFGLIGTAHKGGLRRLVRLDPESTPADQKPPLWALGMAATPKTAEAQPIDLDADGRDEFIIGTNASGNAEKLALDGTKDDQTHLWAINMDGTVLWRTPIADTFTTAYPLIVDLDGDGTSEIHAWVGSSSVDREKEDLPVIGQVLALDRTGRVLSKQAMSHDLHSAVAVPAKGARQGYLLVADVEGNLHRFGPGLQTRSVTKIEPKAFTHIAFTLRGIADLDGDGDDEVIAIIEQREYKGEAYAGRPDDGRNAIHIHRPRVIVLDQELHVIAEWELADRWKHAAEIHVGIGRVDASGKPAIVIAAAKVHVLRLK